MMSDILKEADEIAGESRSRDYGHPLQNHQRIADIWNVQLGPKLNKPIEAREVALMMVGLKLAREVNTSKRDNLVDAAGYIKCIDMIDDALCVGARVASVVKTENKTLCNHEGCFNKVMCAVVVGGVVKNYCDAHRSELESELQ